MLDVQNVWNYAYTAEIYIGTPPQPITAIFDTGSANAWVISSEAVEKRAPRRYRDADSHSYDKSASSSVEDPAEEDREMVSISFGSGSLQGYFLRDHCTLGDTEDPEN